MSADKEAELEHAQQVIQALRAELAQSRRGGAHDHVMATHLAGMAKEDEADVACTVLALMPASSAADTAADALDELPALLLAADEAAIGAAHELPAVTEPFKQHGGKSESGPRASMAASAAWQHRETAARAEDATNIAVSDALTSMRAEHESALGALRWACTIPNSANLLHAENAVCPCSVP